MILSNTKKIIYISIPHTGSTFIVRNFVDYDTSIDYKFGDPSRNSFNPNPAQTHLFLSEAAPYLHHPIEEYTIILFVRNPVDYFISDYNFMERCRLGNRNSWYSVDIQDYIERKMTIDERVVDHIKWTIDLNSFFYNRPDKEDVLKSIFLPKVDCIDYKLPQVVCLKFENFSESVTYLYEKLNHKIPNLNQKINFSRQWQEKVVKNETRELIYNSFTKDFDLFGYSP